MRVRVEFLGLTETTLPYPSVRPGSRGRRPALGQAVWPSSGNSAPKSAPVAGWVRTLSA